MARQSYDLALKRVLADEGGYTHDAADPGGPTNYGITIFDVRKYLKADADADDVKALTVDQAKVIYRAHYWNAMRCDELPPGLDYCIFDYGVNSGIYRAAKVLQAKVGTKVDGWIGPKTLAATAAADPHQIIAAICDERLHFLQQLRTWPTYGKGWGHRVAGVRSAALGMVSPDWKPPQQEKPMPDMPTPAPTPAPSKSLRDWVHTALMTAATAIAGWFGTVTLPAMTTGGPKLDQPTINSVVSAVVNPQNAGAILRDPQLKASVDLALLQAIQSGAPGQLLQSGLGLIPGAAPIVGVVEPMVRKIVIEMLQQHMQQQPAAVAPVRKP